MAKRRGPKTTRMKTPSVTSARAPADEFPAWELVDAGRYMPRRIRGSCRGRELG